MATEDVSPEWEPRLVAAARTVASWAHARRSTWTSAPLDVASGASGPTGGMDLSPVEAPVLPTPALPTVPDAGPRAAQLRGDRTPRRGRAFGAHAVRWLARAAAVVALTAATVTGGLYLWAALPTFAARLKAPAPAPDRPPVTALHATGALSVKSTPAGAHVLIDSKPRGVTPLTLTGLSPGRHTVAITSDVGTVQRTVTVSVGETAEIDESIFSGWLAVYAPFDLTIIEGTRVLRPDERGQVILAPGTHELRLVNQALAFDEVRQVDVKPGEAAVVLVAPPPSTLTVTATEATEVWLDGVRVGATPVDALSVPLGTHDVVVRRANGAGRRFSVTVGVKPITLNVDFNQPPV